jgi:hypothetical protein
MGTGLKRLTFAVTPEIETILDKEKQERFYDRSRSDMIRELVKAGLRAVKIESEAADGNHERKV